VAPSFTFRACECDHERYIWCVVEFHRLNAAEITYAADFTLHSSTLSHITSSPHHNQYTAGFRHGVSVCL
jgi:hypothetical protein